MVATRTEVQEVQPISSHKNNYDLNFIRQKIFAYEKTIKDDFNIFKGDLLEREACSFVTSNINFRLVGQSRNCMVIAISFKRATSSF